MGTTEGSEINQPQTPQSFWSALEQTTVFYHLQGCFYELWQVKREFTLAIKEAEVGERNKLEIFCLSLPSVNDFDPLNEILRS